MIQSVLAKNGGESRPIRHAQLLEAAHSGEPLRLKASRADRFLLEDNDKDLAPEQIRGKRVDNDLYVSLQQFEQQPPQLIIENFYGEEGQLLAGGGDGDSYLVEAAPASMTGESGESWIANARPEIVGGQHQFRPVAPYVEPPATPPTQIPLPVEEPEVVLPPASQARLVGMSRDSGQSSADFLTNDGGAGRLLQGHLDGTLQAGEQVQVSTDGGMTWRVATLTTADRWMLVDTHQHMADFSIHVRVVNAQGMSGPVNIQQVTLDSEAADAPSRVMRNGDHIEVTLPESGVRAGDTINLIIGDYRVDYVLTAADMLRGTASLAIPPELVHQAYMIGAAVVDAAGNVSAYRASSSEYSENWLGHALQGNLEQIETAGMSIAIAAGTMGLGIHRNWPVPMPGMLFIGDQLNRSNQDEVTFDLRHGATQVALNVTYAEDGNSFFVFHDVDGLEIGRMFIDSRDGSMTRFQFDAPAGTEIASFIYFANGENAGLALSDFDIRFTEVDFNGATQQVLPGDGSYQGGAADNTFLVGDASVLGNELVDGGAGTDTLRLEGGDQVLDLTLLGDSVRSIEIIDLAETGSNTLKLSLNDVLNHGEVDLFRDSQGERSQMMVKGSAGDIVDLQGFRDGLDPGAWANQGPVTLEGVVYQVFQHSALQGELLVQEGITVNLV